MSDMSPARLLINGPGRAGILLAAVWLSCHFGKDSAEGVIAGFDQFWWNIGKSIDPTHGWWVFPIVLVILLGAPHLVAWSVAPFQLRLTTRGIAISAFAVLLAGQLSSALTTLRSVKGELELIEESTQDKTSIDQLHEDLDQINTELDTIEGDLPAR